MLSQTVMIFFVLVLKLSLHNYSFILTSLITKNFEPTISFVQWLPGVKDLPL
jgi:hypothetical protein